MIVKSSKQTILGVQYLRGLAALGVVLCHYGAGLPGYPLLGQVFSFGQNGVHLFFLISGFIIVYSLNNANYKPNQFFRFLLKRSIRIDPAYYATIILTLVLFKVLSLMPSFKGQAIPFIPQQFLAHIFYVVPFTQYPFYIHLFWTLCIEFQFYLLIGLGYFISESRIYKNMFLLAFSLSCLVPIPNSYNVVFTYAPVFCLGISLVNFYNNNKPVWYEYALQGLFLALIGYQFGWPMFVLLSVSAIAILLVKVNIKPLFWLGNISYSLYLTHFLTYVVFAGVLKRLHVNLAGNPLLWLCTGVLVAIAVAYGFYAAIEKPSLRLSKKIFYKRAA